MRRRTRLTLFAIASLGFVSLYIWALLGLPRLGHYKGPYGDMINQLGTYERHVTDMVTAVNFDYRGIDTLGEEFIMFVSVMGVALLLRKQTHGEIGESSERQRTEGDAPHAETQRDRERHTTPTRKEKRDAEKEDQSRSRNAPSPSDAMRVLTLALVGPLVVFGLYVVTHGQLTPGGGFQGGVILATAPLLVYLAGSYEVFKRITSHELVEIADGVGAGGYALVGFAAMAYGVEFLRNVVPLGTTGNINSGGTIAIIDLAVGMEVAAGFVLILYSFLEETLARQLGNSK